MIPRWLRLLGLTLAGVAIAGATIAAILEVKGRRQDEVARATAERATTIYRSQFQIGTSFARAEQSLNRLQVATISRGDDILVIAKEGRPLFYCSHNYFGTALRFTEGTLIEIGSDEWLVDCL